MEEHYHVIYHICKIIEDFKYPLLSEIEDVANKLTNFRVHSPQLELYGECKNCSEKQAITK
jgi:Fur family peroxide stress response transcriptional regulator